MVYSLLCGTVKQHSVKGVKYYPSTFTGTVILQNYNQDFLLLYVRESWDELQHLAKSRKENLHKSEQCYQVCKDLIDAYGQIEVIN